MGQAKVIELRPSKEKEHKPLTENQAREATAKCYRALENAQVRLADLYFGHADTAMGYGSWDEYCKGEFNGIWLKLPRETRREQAKAMVDLGMSRRAVASALGAGETTIRRDLEEVDQGAPNGAAISTTDQVSTPDSGKPNGPVPALSEPVTNATAKGGVTTPATAKGSAKPKLQTGPKSPKKVPLVKDGKLTAAGKKVHPGPLPNDPGQPLIDPFEVNDVSCDHPRTVNKERIKQWMADTRDMVNEFNKGERHLLLLAMQGMIKEMETESWVHG